MYNVSHGAPITSPINDFQDFLNAMEGVPALRDALRVDILTDQLLQMPVRLETIEADISTPKDNFGSMSGDIDTIKQDVSGMGGDISRIRGTDYESHVATYVHRFLRRSLGINATYSPSRAINRPSQSS